MNEEDAERGLRLYGKTCMENDVDRALKM